MVEILILKSVHDQSFVSNASSILVQYVIFVLMRQLLVLHLLGLVFELNALSNRVWLIVIF